MLWLRGRRPKEPPSWRAKVAATEKRVARWAEGKLKLKEGEILFEDHWVAYKVVFSRRQHGKCGYCEMPIAADPKGGDIDHYHPKAEVTRLGDDPKTWGEEIRGHNSRDPEKPRSASRISRGYWWLAYTWKEYLLTCGTCNEKWKGNLFPREGNPRGDPTPRSALKEKPLLLNPYGDVDPAAHLQFDRVGLVTPRGGSVLGWETIRTCHLGRASLQDRRCVVAKDAWSRITRVLRELKRPSWREGTLRRALGDLLKLGRRDRDHAGMVRILWAQRDPYGYTWIQLRELWRELRTE